MRKPAASIVARVNLSLNADRLAINAPESDFTMDTVPTHLRGVWKGWFVVDFAAGDGFEYDALPVVAESDNKIVWRLRSG